jgi:hypothetical protein
MGSSTLTNQVKARLGYNKNDRSGHSFPHFTQIAEAPMVQILQSVLFLFVVSSGSAFAESVNPLTGHAAGANADRVRTRTVAAADETAKDAFCVLQKRCASCHADGESKGGISKILDYGTVIATLVTPGKPAESRLYIAMEKGRMPKKPVANEVSPDEKISNLAKIKKWIEDGAPQFDPLVNCEGGATPPQPQPQPVNPNPMGPPARNDGKPMTPEIILRRVARDLARTMGRNPEASPYIYLSMGHLDSKLSATQKRAYRDALALMANLTSRGAALELPTDISGGKDGMVYRIDTRKLGWPADAIAKMKTGDLMFNREIILGRGQLQMDGARSRYFEKAIASTMPLDYFVTKASAYEGYSGLLALPDNQADVLNGYNYKQAMTDQSNGKAPAGGAVHKYYITDSQADYAQANREAISFGLPPVNPQTGRPGHFKAAFLSSNYENNKDKADVRKFPLTGVQDVQVDKYHAGTQSHDGMGILQNGLIAPFRHNVDGTLSGEIKELGPRFCFGCHLAPGQDGLYDFTDASDSIREQAIRTATTIVNGQPVVDRKVVQKILNLYPGEEQRRKDFKVFRDGFKASYDQLGIASGNDLDPELRNPALNRKTKDVSSDSFGGSQINYVAHYFEQKKYLVDLAGITGTSEAVLMEMIRREPMLQDLGSPEVVQREGIPADRLEGVIRFMMTRAPLYDKAFRPGSPYAVTPAYGVQNNQYQQPLQQQQYQYQQPLQQQQPQQMPQQQLPEQQLAPQQQQQRLFPNTF